MNGKGAGLSLRSGLCYFITLWADPVSILRLVCFPICRTVVAADPRLAVKMCDPAADTSTVYVRERGKLRLVKGIVLKETKSVSSSSRNDGATKPLVLRKEHFVFTYNAEGSLRYSTKSLFDMCLTFIAGNIHCVESLVGFPDQIGDRLFAASEEKQVFLEPETAPRALQLFSDAYGDMILGSLCLRNRFALLSERMDEIKTFHSLKSLDLFGCGLGDNHDIFQYLTSGSLTSLVQLFIGRNNMSDVGLQTLTAPIRIMKKSGLSHLQVLDLSYNPISERAVGYLACLPKVEKLDLSGTKLRLGTSIKSTMWDLMGLVCSEQPLEIFDHSKCKTEGWAEQVINQWEKNAAQLPKQKEIGESRKAALHFFGRQKFVRDVLDAMPLAQEQMEEKDKRDRLQFCKPQETSLTTEIKLSGTTRFYKQLARHGVKKRQRESQNNDDQQHGPPSKRFSPSTLTAEDMELLDNY